MRRKSLWIVFSLIMLIILALAGLTIVSRPRQVELSYDASPQKVIISADSRTYGGIPPRDQPACLGQIYPNLRVWGDGTLFYENWSSGQAEPSYWSGQLTPDQVHALLTWLGSQGFFSGWTVAGVNPAGQFMNFSVHLRQKDIEFTAEVPQPQFFNQLIEQILPQLVRVDQRTMTDARITSLIAVYQTCIAEGKFTPTPPKPTPTPIYLPTLPYPYPAPTIHTPASSPTSTIIPVLTEEIYQDAGLLWQECNLLYKDWQSGEECLGVELPDWSETERGFFGYQQDGIGTITQTVGNDAYEGIFISWNDGQEEYALRKNGEVVTTITAEQEGYDPNRSLINLNGKILWEFAGYQHETVIYDGKDLRQGYGADALYLPYLVGRRLILVARQGSKYFIVYDGQKIGPDFDKIEIAYCCEPAMYSIRRVKGEYWFWGDRNKQNYLVRIAATGH